MVHHNHFRMSLGTSRPVGTRQVKIRVKPDQQDRCEDKATVSVDLHRDHRCRVPATETLQSKFSGAHRQDPIALILSSGDKENPEKCPLQQL